MQTRRGNSESTSGRDWDEEEEARGGKSSRLEVRGERSHMRKRTREPKKDKKRGKEFSDIYINVIKNYYKCPSTIYFF